MKSMKLLKFDKYIEKNNIKEVTSTKIYDSFNKANFDKTGLFSEAIFGTLGSKERRSRMGFINLYCKVIHPESFKILSSVSPDINKLIADQKKYVLNDKNILEENEDLGDSGIFYFTQIFTSILSNFLLIFDLSLLFSHILGFNESLGLKLFNDISLAFISSS